MRILQLVLAPRLSGAEMLVKGIAIGHRACGHTVGVASLLPAEDGFAAASHELAGHDVACFFPSRRHEHLARLLFLFRAVRRFAPDIIFAHATIPAIYARALPCAAPVVFVMHSGANDFADNRRLRWAERLLSRRARAVIGVSLRNVEQYASTIGPHPALFVVPNGVDVERFRGASGKQRAAAAPAIAAQAGSIGGADLRARSGAGREPGEDEGEDGARSAQEKRIVQIGRYTVEKGQLDTVRAFREVLAREPNARLHLYGVVEDRAYHAQVVALVDALGIASRVRIDGPSTDVPGILARAAVFAMPSRLEAHSIGFLEALASGVPVVANTISAFAFARDYPGVALVDTTDVAQYAHALADALSQPRAARSLTGLTLDETARRYLEIAEKVLA